MYDWSYLNYFLTECKLCLLATLNNHKPRSKSALADYKCLVVVAGKIWNQDSRYQALVQTSFVCPKQFLLFTNIGNYKNRLKLPT